MDLEFTVEDEQFRQAVSRFIAENYPDELRRAQKAKRELTRDEQLMWQKVLARRGWAAPHWPVEWGGQDWTPTQRFIFSEELAKAETFVLVPFGLVMLAPVLWTYGTLAQKQRFLPQIYNGDIWFCQGYSEPGAGSDLASLRTRAERVREPDGEEYYLVNGQKTWTTLAQHADWGFFLVRTDPDARPQAGISFLLIDMKSPGVSVRRITTIEGGHEVNDVFLDNVKVPLDNLVHEENKGWTCAKALLQHERTSIAEIAQSRVLLARLKQMAVAERDDDGAPLWSNPVFRRKLTRIEVELESLAMSELRVVGDVAAGRDPGPVSSIFKVRGTEIRQRLTELAMEIVGWDAGPVLHDLEQAAKLVADDAKSVAWDYLNSRKLSIFGGSNEIQRNIIAKVALGL